MHIERPLEGSVEVHIGIMEKMETTVVYWGYIGIMGNKMEVGSTSNTLPKLGKAKYWSKP